MMKQRPFRLYPWFLYPAPADYDLPPTIYSLLESIVNFNVSNSDKTKIKDLAKMGHSTIFDFDYPFYDDTKKADFEIMILNHFLMRRIGYDTLTAFQIGLNVKLNEIMPVYNKMFLSLENWSIDTNGEVVTRIQKETRDSTGSNTESVINSSTINSDGTSNNISDRRFSNTPQSKITDVQDGSYVTNYNYDNNHDENNSTTRTSADSNTTSSNSNNDTNNLNETITRTPSDKLEIMIKYQEKVSSIYTLIFQDLDSLFYQLV